MPFPVVAIGASAGGLEALSELLGALPPKSEMAYVVISHLDPAHPSLLPELLAKRTTLPVVQIQEELAVEPDHVYVLPPNVTVTLNGERFHLAARAAGVPHHPVDIFFTALAETRAGAAVGVVLSGADADGAVGVQAVREHGGINFAQEPATARFPAMPKSAIETGCVDFVLRPSKIAHEIMRLGRHPYLRSSAKPLPAEAHDSSESNRSAGEEEGLRRMFRRLRTAHGIDFTHYKRSTLRRRLARRMAVRKSENLSGYLTLLEDDPAEAAALYQDFLIRVSSFFRDPESFESLCSRVFPSLCENRSAKEPLRLWVPGCASGEEVYSIAITLMEHLGDGVAPAGIQIFGTDVSEVAIEKARAGSYPDTIAQEVSPERLKRFFVKEDSHYHIAKGLRDLCIFARQDVTRDPPFSRLDLVSCRNVLIYLNAPAQLRVLQLFHYALRPRGFLVLGPSESVGAASHLFELIDKPHRIYARKVAASLAADLELGDPESAEGRARPGAPEESPAGLEMDSAQRKADRLLLARYAPASLLVNETLDILQIRGETGRYLEHASGPPSLNLRRVVRPELLVEIAPAIQEARESGTAVRREGLRVDENTEVALEVMPLQSPDIGYGYLIVFEDVTTRWARRAQATAALPESEKDRRIAQLSREVTATREYLQATTEEHEAVKEELKSAHEEVLSANEEFHSTNEELETAKEELQSANEELTTTNEELRNRNRDLTALNNAVRRARAYADAIITTVSSALFVLDPELKVLRANRAFYKNFRTRPEDTEGHPLREIGGGQWSIPGLLDQLTHVLTRDAAVDEYELKYSSAGLGERVLHMTARKIPGDAERAELILVVLDDVTERKAGTERLQAADRQKDEFLAMLAHELRNPLAPISHTVHLLKQGEGSAVALKHYGLLERQVTHLVHLVDQLLDVARINRGQIDLKREIVDLVQPARTALEAVQTKLEERRQELRLELPETPIYVEGDAERLEQVISNLLGNAIKYTEPRGRIALSLTTEQGEAVLRVHDNGIGIAPANLESIFGLFTQLESTLARSRGGLGIGLTLVRRLLALHGARIEAHSRGLGQGSEFIVHFPLLPPDRIPQITESKRIETPPTNLAGPARRVLIVDDSADSAESLAMLVRTWGHEVATTYDGPSALALAKRFQPNSALVDIGLPVMDGYELARQLRAQAQHRELYLVAMTGYGRQEDRRAALEAGFDAHLVKPADIDQIRMLLGTSVTT